MGALALHRVLGRLLGARVTSDLHAAMTRLRPPDQRQSDAVEARIELDLRVGAAFTRFQTMALQQRFGQLADHTLSYGQTAPE